jgi:ribosome-associated protein
MEEVTKSKSLEREEISETMEFVAGTTPFDELDQEVKLALSCAEEKKAVKPVALDLREITSFTEFFLILGGTNQRHVQAIVDEVTSKLRDVYKFKPIRIEGYSAADWVLVDYGDFVVHVFNEKSRAFYELERLWRDAKKVELPEQEAGQ